jgi:hypothetical protein
MIEAGFIIFLGFLFLAIKLKVRTQLILLGYPLALDLIASVLAYILHWGTFSGVMAAAVAGMLTSLLTSLGRKAIGYVNPKTGQYTRGWWDKSGALDP